MITSATLKVISVTTKAILPTDEVITATLNVISDTTKVILTTEEVNTTILKFTSTTTKPILATEEVNTATLKSYFSHYKCDFGHWWSDHSKLKNYLANLKVI